jgi:GNAT superfamily N-acetyltransferase
MWRRRLACRFAIASSLIPRLDANMTPVLVSDPDKGPAILSLLQRAFAGMEGRINPPSSLHALTVKGLFATGEVWAMGAPPVACVILTPRAEVLYLGKLAVDAARQGQGLARRLVTLAEARARGLGLGMLELQTRVELVENHQVFTRLGFVETARTAHAGFAQPTSITYRKKVLLHA